MINPSLVDDDDDEEDCTKVLIIMINFQSMIMTRMKTNFLPSGIDNYE